MPDWLKQLREFISLDARALFVLGAGAWTVVLLPANLWEEFGLIDVWTLSRPWAFLIALVASILLVAGGLFDLAKSDLLGISGRLKLWSSQKHEAAIMQGTSRVEREVLARYIAADTTTLAFEVRDGIVNGLASKGVLFRSSNLTNPMSYNLDTNMQPWAWKYLHDHPDLLKGIEMPERTRHQVF